jgi:hypothetical protein
MPKAKTAAKPAAAKKSAQRGTRGKKIKVDLCADWHSDRPLSRRQATINLR